MAPPADLKEIGLEGFALIEKYYGTQRSNNGGFPARHGRLNGHSQIEEPPLNSNEVAAQHAGIIIMNYPKGKPQNRWGRPTRP